MKKLIRVSRHYEASPLPTLKENGDDSSREILLALYAQVCISWRELIGIRFKLLALVPTVSVLLQAGILSGEGMGKGLPLIAKTGLAAFGFLATIGLLIYDSRNSGLHDDLISRGRKIEEELGINTGQFRGRLNPPNRLINHSNALRIIYGTALTGWLFAIVVLWIGK